MAHFQAPKLPAVGSRVGTECGPGEFAKDHAGTVLRHVTDRWGTHAVVQMDDGTTGTCHGLNSGPGIGWHQIAQEAAAPVLLSTCDECGAKVRKIIGCPDGAEICQACFDAGEH